MNFVTFVFLKRPTILDTIVYSNSVMRFKIFNFLLQDREKAKKISDFIAFIYVRTL